MSRCPLGGSFFIPAVAGNRALPPHLQRYLQERDIVHPQVGMVAGNNVPSPKTRTSSMARDDLS